MREAHLWLTIQSIDRIYALAKQADDVSSQIMTVTCVWHENKCT